jgi:hypothetical protein
MYSDYPRRLPDDPILIDAMRQVEKPISNIVRVSLGASWSSTAYHLRRGHRAPQREPGKPSVNVTCQPGSIARFDIIEE